MELDPIFSKALKLLHSKNKDSEDQLRAMLEDAIKQRHGNSKLLGSSFMKKVQFIIISYLLHQNWTCNISLYSYDLPSIIFLSAFH